MTLIDSIDTRVAGVTFYNEGINGEYRQSIIHDMKVKGQLEIGQLLQLQPQPWNSHDPNAVAVLAPDGRQIGFIPRDYSEAVVKKLGEGKTVIATITNVQGGISGIGYKLSICVEFYEQEQGAFCEDEITSSPSEKIYLTSITIKGLFGIYNYKIDGINKDISLLHAINGSGKTTILNLLNKVINCEYDEFDYIEVQEFSLAFSNNVRITLFGDKSTLSYKIAFFYPKRHIIPSGIDYESGRILPVSDSCIKELTKSCTGRMHVKYIKANRLYDLSKESLKEQVIICREKIISTIHNAKENFMQMSETLDTSFLYRVMQVIQQKYEHYNSDECSKRYNALEKQRDEYARYGLVNEREKHANDKVSFNFNENTSDEILQMITMYVRDGETKNKMIATVYERIGLLLKILNSEHEFCRKKLEIDFSHNDPVEFVADTGCVIPLTLLSSGEKNDFILFTDLIFDTNDSTLVLIDEPEISLHPAWQILIVDELIRIGKINNFQTIVATHSPNIVSEHWDKLTDLEET